MIESTPMLLSRAAARTRAVVPLSDADYARLAAFRHALRDFLNFSEAAAARIGLTGQQYQALLVVRAVSLTREMTVSELARHLLIKHHSAVGLVDRLQDQGHLLRRPSPLDGRKVELRLTAKGTRVLGRLADLHRHELAQAGPQLMALLAQITPATEHGPGP
jgi:DNA-binding MarR family transcriptional regulator